MAKVIEKMRKNVSVRLAIISGLAVTLSGCVYGYGDVGYYAGGYASECDPYNEFDSYYDCDNRFGFVNIGYGGGWHDNYYYPGHGLYLFDSYGRRYNLHDNYRRYWAQQRYSYYQNRARRYGGSQHNGGQYNIGQHHGGQHRGGQYDGRQHGGQQHHDDGQYSGGQNSDNTAGRRGRRVRDGIARDLGGSSDAAQSAARNAAGGGVAASAGRPFRNFTPGGNDTQGNAQPRSSVRQQAVAAAQAASSQVSVRQVQQLAASAPERQQRAEPAARPSPPARAAQPSNRQPNQGANQRTGGRVQDF